MTDPLQQQTTATSPRKPWWRRVSVLFVASVLFPTFVATAYYGVIASDVYISESRFVVRSPQRPAPSGLGALLQGTVFSRSQDDTYSVHDYILSRDALAELDRLVGLRQAYGREDIDFVNRFPGLERWDTSFEALLRHYRRHVSIVYDSVSSISVLTVRAYSADDAQRINTQLLDLGEKLVNTMNARSRADLISVAEVEVRQAEQRAIAAALALSGFRSERSVFDPDRQGAIQLQSVAKLRDDLIAAEAQVEQVRRVSPSNPQLPGLQARVDGLRKAIEDETARVTSGRGSLSAKSPAFDRLQLEKAFADRQLAAALASLDSARSEAMRKQLYLERLVQPNRPDRAVEPRRLRGIVTVLVFGLLLWGVLSLVVASVREHAD